MRSPKRIEFPLLCDRLLKCAWFQTTMLFTVCLEFPSYARKQDRSNTWTLPSDCFSDGVCWDHPPQSVATSAASVSLIQQRLHSGILSQSTLADLDKGCWLATELERWRQVFLKLLVAQFWRVLCREVYILLLKIIKLHHHKFVVRKCNNRNYDILSSVVWSSIAPPRPRTRRRMLFFNFH